MKSRSFVLSAIILALGGFFAKAIGAVYKIPLTNILGSSGMGLYYLVFPIYSLFITLCSSGVNVALATEVAKCRKIRHRYNEQKLLRVSLLLSFVLSLFFTILIIVISYPISELQGNINARLGYVAIAPAIILSSIIATVRGYFQGVENMVPTTVSMIVEQITKLSVGLVLAYKLCELGVQYAVLGAIIGVTVSEAVALIIIAINFISFKGQLYYNYKNKYYIAKKKGNIKSKIKTKKVLSIGKIATTFSIRYCCNSKASRYSTKVALSKVFKVFFPSTMSSIILPVATMLDSFLLINLLVAAGFSSVVSTALYGLWGGVVQTIISLPIILIAGISMAIVPSLSGVVAGQNVARVNRRVKFFIKITWVMAILMFVMVFVFSKDILTFLYGNGLGNSVINEREITTKMLQIASVSIIYSAFLQTFTAILQSIGKSHVPLLTMLVSLIIRIVLTIILVSVPGINIFGAIIANIVFLGFTVIFLALYIRSRIDLEFKFCKELLYPLLIGSVVLVLMYMLKMGLELMLNYFLSMLISAVVGIIVFGFWVYCSQIFTIKEKKEFFKKRTKKLKSKERSGALTQKNP